MTDADHIALLYRCLLGREPDEGGMAHHRALLESCGDLRMVIASITSSPEYHARQLPPAPINLSRLLRRPLTIIDVGAQNLADEEHIYAPLLRSGLPCTCIGFEPLDQRRTERAKIGDPRITLFPDFVGDGSEQTFYINNEDATSSLLPLNQEFNSAFNHLRDLQTIDTKQVLTSRLDDILTDLPSLDFLKLDIQGFELPALQGAGHVLEKTNVVHCEVEFSPIYAGQHLFSEVESLLRSKGFDFIDFTSLCRYVYVSVPQPTEHKERLIWADAVFFRNFKQTSGTLDDAIAQAAIASHVYSKNGLAKQILMEFGQGHVLATSES